MVHHKVTVERDSLQYKAAMRTLTLTKCLTRHTIVFEDMGLDDNWEAYQNILNELKADEAYCKAHDC